MARGIAKMDHKVNIERVVEQFVELTSMDSLSFKERRVADFIKRELMELGFEVTEDDTGSVLGSEAGNVYGILKGNDPSRKPLLLSAHMDTVIPGTGKKPVVDIEKGIITSEGDTVLGADDAAGIVSILEAIRIIQNEEASYGDIEVLFTAAEEVYCKGASEFNYEKIRSKTAFVIDLSGNTGIAAHAAPSIISFDFEIHGKPAHAGFDPDAGINAIAVASEIIAGIDQGMIAEGLTLNIGTISGGSTSNIVSDLCRCTGEVRGNDHKQAMETVRDIERRVGSVSSKAGAESSFNSSVMIKAYETACDAEPCRIFRKACDNLGLEGRLVSTRGGSDNNIFAEHGIEGIVVSCGMMDIHSVSEYIEIRDLELSPQLVAEMITLS